MKFDVETEAGPGSFIIKVHEDWAPIGAAHFKKYKSLRETRQARKLNLIAHAHSAGPGVDSRGGLTGHFRRF